MPVDYNKTLNLPATDFPMRAALPEKEPVILKKWYDEDIYNELLKKYEGKPLYILHDGPPYANGDIHTGHALNKIIKDIILKHKNMTGYKVPYIPGWDTHGLPIELQAIKKIGINRNKTSVLEFRNHCKNFAVKYVENQKEQFKRLGVLGDWDNPYLTLSPEFEAKQIEVFGEMVHKGFIYKGLKPVYWCPHDETALAEAEIEYSDDKCDSIYVKFRVTKDFDKLTKITSKSLKDIYFVIWTTTTWTLPGNVAISVNPKFEYSLVEANDEVYIIATDLIPSVIKAANIENYKILGALKGSELEYMKVSHPFLPRESLVIVGDHVTMDSGTGCVHTAPGHGVDDFIVCKNYKEIPIIVPVDSKGVLTSDAGEFEGIYYEKSNALILEKLKELNALLAVESIVHQYPHCWRCKSPIIFRATSQWFCSVEDFKNEAITAAQGVKWVPAWGEDRIISMIRDRNDWCLSRQRIWGVPIPAFYCNACGKYHITPETIKKLSDIFKKEGTDAWYKYSAKELLPDNFTCSCGGKEFTKETDIMDVWFDSGSSHAAVLETRAGLRTPADLYLEGNDQYRGWFQSSLLTSIAYKGIAPYKTVLTHGIVVDKDGKKMSKSLGNGIDPIMVCKEYGADILRLWVASSDYKVDIRFSNDILKQLSESYRKIRNTARFILSCINDFDPNTDSIPYDNLNELDKWALISLDELINKVKTAYEEYEYHIVFHSIHNFCVVTMSNFYLDIIKDRLYVENANSAQRRCAQTVIYKVLSSLVKMLAPILCFTSEEIWQYMPHLFADDIKSIYFNQLPDYEKLHDEKLMDKWNRILDIRDDVKKALEAARAAKIIGSSLDAELTLYCDDKLYDFLSKSSSWLETIFICSKVNLDKFSNKPSDATIGLTEGLAASVKKASGEKCVRCWIYSETVNSDSDYPGLCERCAKIIKNN